MTARLQAAFEKFHAQNPKVYDLVDRFTREAIAAGFTNYSMSAIIERVRWHTSVETKSEDGLKIANAHRAYYARLWMRFNKDHGTFFHTAELRSLEQEHKAILKAEITAKRQAEQKARRQDLHLAMRHEL